jgi:hypothetical protein
MIEKFKTINLNQLRGKRVKRGSVFMMDKMMTLDERAEYNKQLIREKDEGGNDKVAEKIREKNQAV